jgi:putative hydrolase of the HAD superfamily
MVKVILFDFWGTLVEQGVWSPVKQVRNVLNLTMPFSEYIIRMEKAMMTSKFENLSDSFKAICQEFNIESDEKKIETLVGLWNKSWMLAEPYPEMINSLKELKDKGYVLVLIANSDPFSVENVLNKFSMNELFDHKYLSYQTGKIKSDPNSFRRIMQDLQIMPEDCVMVGDGIQSDIIPAKSVGIKAVLVDRRNTRDFHPKIKNLEELEKVLSI